MLKQRKITISGGFWILLGWFALANGIWLTAMILLAATLHELGHLLAIYWQGGRLYRLDITVFGAEMTTDIHSVGYGGELLCLLAGVMVNGVCALVFCKVWPVFAGVHISLCLLNVLPIRPLDGGRALELLLRWRFNPIVSHQIASGVERSCGFLVGLGLVWLVWKTGGSLWLVPAATAFLGLAVKNR